MASDQVVTAWQAIAELAPWVGAGGVSSILVAYFSYRKAQAEGRRGDSDKAKVGISVLYSDDKAMEKLVLSIDRLALAADKISLLTAETKHDLFEKVETFIDEFRKFRRMLEDKD